MIGLARLAGAAALSLSLLSHSALAADAAATGATTVTGRLACAMCILKQPGVKTCTNVLVTQQAGKEVVYGVADNEVSKAFVMAACEKALPVKITGTVAEAAGKKTITPTKIEKA